MTERNESTNPSVIGWGFTLIVVSWVLLTSLHVIHFSVDFDLYYAGGHVEHSQRFGDVHAVQSYLQSHNLIALGKRAPYPYGSVVLVGLVFYALAYLPYVVARLIFYGVINSLLAWGAWRFSTKVDKRIALVLLYFSFPVMALMIYGNWLLVTTTLIVHALCDLREGRDVRAGIWIGLAAIFKLNPALLVVPFIVKRHWGPVRGFAASFFGSALVALLFMGPRDFVHGVSATLASSHAPSSLMNRLNVGLPGLVESLSHNHSLNLPVAVVAIAVSFLLIWNLRSIHIEDLVLVTIPMIFLAAPITWPYYSLMCWPLLIVMLGDTRARQRLRTLPQIIQGIGVMLFIWGWLPWQFIPPYLHVYASGNSPWWEQLATAHSFFLVLATTAAFVYSRVIPEYWANTQPTDSVAISSHAA